MVVDVVVQNPPKVTSTNMRKNTYYVVTPRCAAAAVVSALVLRRPTKEYTHPYSMMHRTPAYCRYWGLASLSPITSNIGMISIFFSWAYCIIRCSNSLILWYVRESMEHTRREYEYGITIRHRYIQYQVTLLVPHCMLVATEHIFRRRKRSLHKTFCTTTTTIYTKWSGIRFSQPIRLQKRVLLVLQ